MMKSNHEPDKIASGVLLAAAPELTDPNFSQTLVYVAEHDPNGSMGFILNRPTGQHLRDILSHDANVDSLLHGVPVYFGGPVKPQNLFLVLFQRGATANDLRCQLNVPVEQMHAHLVGGTGWVRGFMGYSGWGEGQLEQEMAGRAWILRRPHESLMSDHPSPMMWSVFIGDDQRWRELGSHLPPDPSKN